VDRPPKIPIKKPRSESFRHRAIKNLSTILWY
jgi:hypothetical protein